MGHRIVTESNRIQARFQAYRIGNANMIDRAYLADWLEARELATVNAHRSMNIMTTRNPARHVCQFSSHGSDHQARKPPLTIKLTQVNNVEVLQTHT